MALTSEIAEHSQKGILLRVDRHMPVGTMVQLQQQGDCSLWKVFGCVPHVRHFYVALETVDAIPSGTSVGVLRVDTRRVGR